MVLVINDIKVIHNVISVHSYDKREDVLLVVLLEDGWRLLRGYEDVTKFYIHE
jgi:hypothetical protein